MSEKRVAREQRPMYGEDPELYDRIRPGYPPELIDDVVALVGAGARAVDAGCGTGKAAVPLAARGLAGVGVDQDPAMVSVARRQLAGFAGWRVDISPFEDWSPAPDEVPYELVVSAQAWHWFDPEASFRKAHELLGPGGWLVLWWNGPADFDSPARMAIDEAYARHAPEIVYRGVAGHPRPEIGPLPADVSLGPPVLRDYPAGQSGRRRASPFWSCLQSGRLRTCPQLGPAQGRTNIRHQAKGRWTGRDGQPHTAAIYSLGLPPRG